MNATCKRCGEPISRCQIPGFTCWFHTGHGWHRCDGKPLDGSDGDTAVAQPEVAA